MNTTWWRTHPVAHRLLAVLVCELLLAAVPGRGFGALLWLAVDVWLVTRVRRSSWTAWIVLLALSVLAAGFGIASAVLTGPALSVLAVVGLNVAVCALLLTPTVRGWVGRSGLLSLPGEH
ncbi:hypothetical protein [Kineococcus sp. SYSU DK003]|uniref:hypothetical protein n=1 Tax=Kineococcus sp. SYSU DK003 TaxID=3383124 RepID=UPI003D7DBC27